MTVYYMKEGLIGALLRFKDVMIWASSGIYNFIAYMIVFIISILTPYKDMIVAICILSIIDWILAVANAIKRNNLQSTKMLSLVGKLIMYCTGFLMAGACKVFVDIAFFEWMITTSILFGELISLLSNMILVWDKSPVLRILDKVLKSELAAKLNISKEDVEEAIKNSSKKKK